MFNVFERANEIKKNLIKSNNKRLNKLDIKREKQIKILKGKNLVTAKRERIKEELKSEKNKAFNSSFIGKIKKEVDKNKSKKKKGLTAQQRSENYMNRKPPSWL